GIISYQYYVFVTKLNPTGSGLVYSHVDPYLLAANSRSVAVDGASRAYYTGQRTLTGPHPAAEMFANELDSNGSLLHAYQASGSNIAGGLALAIDGQGNTYVAGWTNSTDFPTVNAYQSVFHGGEDAFILKLNANWGLVFSTYLGG